MGKPYGSSCVGAIFVTIFLSAFVVIVSKFLIWVNNAYGDLAAIVMFTVVMSFLVFLQIEVNKHDRRN